MVKKIAIIGTAFGSIDDDLISKCYELGEWISANKLITITGACPGISYYVAKASLKNGGEVIGYSPGRNLEEHINSFNFPSEGFSKLKFVKEKYEINEVYFRRSLDVIHMADIVISIDGGRGTMSELFLATFFAKKIICVSFSGGATKEYIKIYKHLKDINISYGEKLLVATSLEDIKKEILNFINKDKRGKNVGSK